MVHMKKILKKKIDRGPTLLFYWLRIHLPMQRTWVQPLVWENSTFRGATEPVHHSC